MHDKITDEEWKRHYMNVHYGKKGSLRRKLNFGCLSIAFVCGSFFLISQFGRVFAPLLELFMR